MNCTFEVPCPNCGGSATRSYFTGRESKYSACPQNRVIQVECFDCDYLMVMCSISGNVIESYSSSTSFFAKQSKGKSAIAFSVSA